MKLNKVFLEFLITLSLLFMPIAISENVYASESDVRMWCMNIPLTRTFQSPYAFIHNHDFTFECDDGCGISSRFVGMGWQATGAGAAYTKTYELIFNKPGEHNVSVYEDGILNENLSGKVIIREDHSYGEAVVEKSETCTSSGDKKYSCVVCGHSYNEIIPATGHDYAQTASKEQTCTEDGYVSYKCTKCNDSYTTAFKAEGHSYTKTNEYAPTCTQAGSKSFVCSKCKNTYQESVPAAGHSYSSWTTNKKATIFNKGIKSRTCSVCNIKSTKTIKKLKSRVSISKTSLNIKRGKKYNLKIKSKTVGDKVKEWSSSKSKTVSVNKKTGKIKALRNGTAVITLKMKSGCTAKCTVRVGVKKNNSGHRNPNQSSIVN
ncbi:MAG: hypothetical protein HFH58_16165 [Lachnospiraceae bacterium]|jgi:hypothetical protein|nr:hypothetical protein [Lachnospiraceae bacterium]